MQKSSIIDLHCDLLSYLTEKEGRTPYDSCARCSIPQMIEGGVALQVMSVFSPTMEGSTIRGQAQLELFKDLETLFPNEFGKTIQIAFAIENASVFFEEDEPLDVGFKRCNHVIETIGKPVYISFTWKSENRFGGGNYTTLGLKEDGKALLEYLSGKKIAFDLSHTSDLLAEEVLNEIERKGYTVPVIASHSNLRSVNDVPRNLTDEFAKEIGKRGGIIGFNFIRPFISEGPSLLFTKHVDHAIKLGLEDNICFGADFFCDTDFEFNHLVPIFFDDYGNSSIYPKVLAYLNDDVVNKIAHQNFIAWAIRQGRVAHSCTP